MKPGTILDMFSGNNGKNPILKETYAEPKKKTRFKKLKEFMKGCK